MGTVYRARDSRLRRDLAIKVLHHSIQEQPTRLQRFQEEARAAGSLTHPNILAVYDVGMDGDTPYIAMELVDGVSLRQLLDGTALPAARLLEVAIQIADGLAAAHHASLVHRDLKPANVMVTRDGRVKLVDFGLVKAPAHADDGNRTLTAPHAVIGTASYMSPEQARGSTVDFRSDIFSFGTILLEMITGRAPFERATAIETLTAILHEQPQLPPLSERMPLALNWIVQRCLAKDPAERYGATADLHHDLRAVRDRRPPGVDAANRSQGQPRLINVRRLAIGFASIAVAAALFVAGFSFAPAAIVSSPSIVPFASEAGYEGSGSWSPDGRTIAYLAEEDGIIQVMIRSLDASTFGSAPITDSVSDCRAPFWNADGSRIFYISQAGERDALWSVGTAGGSAQVEMRDVSAATFRPDGSALVFLRETQGGAELKETLWVSAPFKRGEARRFAEDWPGVTTAGVSFIRFSPDGQTVALWANSEGATGTVGAVDSAEIWLFPFPSGSARRVLASLGHVSRPHPFSWMPDSRRLVFGADGLGSSPGTHLWIGDTATDRFEPLTNTASNEYEPSVSPVSPDGARIVFTSQSGHYDLIEIPLDGTEIRARPSSDRELAEPSWSGQGQQFAYITNRAGPQEIWRSTEDGSLQMPVVTERNFRDKTYLLSRVAYAPDGQRLAYQRRNREGYFIWLSSITGGPAARLLNSDVAIYQDAPTWSPDGTWIAFTYRDRNGRWWLGKTKPGADGEIIPIRENIDYPATPHWSPDGRWVLCELRDGLYAIAVEGTEQRLVSQEPWLAHTWSRDGKAVLALRETDDRRLQFVSIDVRDRKQRVIAADLGPSPPTTPALRGFSLSPDGKRILTSIVRLRGDLYLLEGIGKDQGLWTKLREALGW